MFYIFLSSFIALVELSLSFLFVNYLQEIYLFDLYKVLGLSVNIGYFVSVMILIFMYYFISWILGSFLSKSIHHFAYKEVSTFFQKSSNNIRYIGIIKKIYRRTLYKKMVIFMSIILISFLVADIFHLSSILSIGVAILSALTSTLFIRNPIKMKNGNGINIEYIQKISGFNTVSIPTATKIFEGYKKYIFLMQYESVKINLRNSGRNMYFQIMAIIFMLIIFAYHIEWREDSALACILFVMIFLIMIYFVRDLIYLTLYKNLIKTSLYQSIFQKREEDIDLQIKKDENYVSLIYSNLVLYFISIAFFLFHGSFLLFVGIIIIVNIILLWKMMKK